MPTTHELSSQRDDVIDFSTNLLMMACVLRPGNQFMVLLRLSILEPHLRFFAQNRVQPKPWF